jgi:hypothetical protein
MQLKRIWQDHDGKTVLWQRPNKWLIIWAFAEITGFLLGQSSIGKIIHWLGASALIIWSLLEISRGVNYFRRGLGLVVLLISLVSIFKAVY